MTNKANVNKAEGDNLSDLLGSNKCPMCGRLKSIVVSNNIKMGLMKAQIKGKKLGRPIIISDMNQIYILWLGGHSLRDIAKALNLSKSLVHNRLKKFKKLKPLLDTEKLRKEINAILKDYSNEEYASCG